MLLRLRLVILSALAYSPASYAQGWDIDLGTGNGFLAACEQTEDARTTEALEFGFCYGWMDGFLAAHAFYPQPIFCRPSGATNGQLMSILLDGVRRNPQDRHRSMTALGLVYWTQAFPCDRSAR